VEVKKPGGKNKKIMKDVGLMIFFNKKQRGGSFNCLLIHMFLESEF